MPLGEALVVSKSNACPASFNRWTDGLFLINRKTIRYDGDRFPDVE